MNTDGAELCQAAPYISVSPGMRAGRPVIHGHRLAADEVAERYWNLGGSLQTEILDYWGLTRAEVIVACWFVVDYGARVWNRRWGTWVNDVWEMTHFDPPAGWWSDLSGVPLPPHKVQKA